MEHTRAGSAPVPPLLGTPGWLPPCNRNSPNWHQSPSLSAFAVPERAAQSPCSPLRPLLPTYPVSRPSQVLLHFPPGLSCLVKGTYPSVKLKGQLLPSGFLSLSFTLLPPGTLLVVWFLSLSLQLDSKCPAGKDMAWFILSLQLS